MSSHRYIDQVLDGDSLLINLMFGVNKYCQTNTPHSLRHGADLDCDYVHIEVNMIIGGLYWRQSKESDRVQVLSNRS